MRFAPYQPRTLNCLGVEDWSDYRLKVYSIRYGDHPFDRSRFAACPKLAAEALPQPARDTERPGVGFAILHQGKTGGVDLAGMFSARIDARTLTLIEASLTAWNPAESCDLITCIHGLHYIVDKLGLIARGSSWLNREGFFIASLDAGNLRLNPNGTSSRVFAKELWKAHVEYLPGNISLDAKAIEVCLCRLTILGPMTKLDETRKL